jgi:hypothetical protein
MRVIHRTWMQSSGVSRAIAALDACLDHSHHVSNVVLLRQPFAVVDAEHLHAFMVLEVGQQLWGDEEVLSTVRFAGDVDHRVVDSTFSPHVHTLKKSQCGNYIEGQKTHLIDLVNKGEWCSRLLRQTHEIEDGGQGSFLDDAVNELNGIKGKSRSSDARHQTAVAQLRVAASHSHGT